MKQKPIVTQKQALTGAVTIYAVGTLRSQFDVWIAKLPRGRRGVALGVVSLLLGSAITGTPV